MQTIIALLLLASSPEAAPATTGTDTTQAKPVKVKKICRPGASTGSRLTPKICKTQAEWDAMVGADLGKGKSDSGAGY